MSTNDFDCVLDYGLKSLKKVEKGKKSCFFKTHFKLLLLYLVVGTGFLSLVLSFIFILCFSFYNKYI